MFPGTRNIPAIFPYLIILTKKKLYFLFIYTFKTSDLLKLFKNLIAR